MTQYNNSLSLFNNDKKEKDTHPDMNGHGTVDGREYWVAAWNKTGKSGKAFISIALKPKDAQKLEDSPAYEASDDDQNIPF